MDRNKMMKLLVQFFIGAVSFILIYLLISRISSACPLTQEQIDALNNISYSLNISNNTLVSIFYGICYNISFSVNYTTNVNNGLSSSISNVNYNIINNASNLTSLYNTINTGYLINSSNFYNRTETDMIRNFLQSGMGNITEAMDDIYQNIRSDYATNKSVEEIFNNISLTIDDKIYGVSSTNQRMINEKCSTARMTWFWLFLIASGLIGGLAYMLRYKPEIIDKYVSGMKGIRRSATETTTPGEYSAKIERVRELSKIAVNNDLRKEQKQELLNKIRTDEIKDEKGLNDETEIMKKLEKGRK